MKILALFAASLLPYANAASPRALTNVQQGYQPMALPQPKQLLLTWINNYDPCETNQITVVKSSTDLKSWTARAYTTNGWILMPIDKPWEFFCVSNTISTNT